MFVLVLIGEEVDQALDSETNMDDLLFNLKLYLTIIYLPYFILFVCIII